MKGGRKSRSRGHEQLKEFVSLNVMVGNLSWRWLSKVEMEICLYGSEAKMYLHGSKISQVLQSEVHAEACEMAEQE